jgi:hypothetical protein
MCEITAFKDNQPLMVCKDKSIGIEMASRNQDSRFNLYKFDTASGKWSCLGKDAIKTEEPPPGSVSIPSKGDAKSLANIRPAWKDTDVIFSPSQSRMDRLLKKKPVPPKKADKDKRSFTLDIDKNEFPELAGYQDVKFEISDDNKNFNTAWYNVTWEDVSLEQGLKPGTYDLTLRKGKEAHTLIVYPALEGKDYETAMAEYNKKFSEYTSGLQKRKADEKRIAEENKKRTEEDRLAYAKYKEEQEKLEKEQEKAAAVETTNEKIRSGIYRTFMATGFGVYNCDNPVMWPKGASVAARFTDEKGKPLDLQYVYLAQMGMNAIFEKLPEEFADFSYNPDRQNMLWSIVDGHLAVFRPEDFAKVPRKTGPYTFKMTICKEELRTTADVRRYLGLDSPS